jgi:uncharacterized protein involved in response to NO
MKPAMPRPCASSRSEPPDAGVTGRAKIVPFAHGFRPFFLAAIAYGLFVVLAWWVVRERGIAVLGEMPPQLWHGHEMLFGFATAAIAGFLLTAVPSWTQVRGFAGAPLVALTAVWVLGRIAFASSSVIPIRTVALFELAFLPLLAAIIAVPLLRSRNRNTVLLLALLALWLTDATFLCALALHDTVLASDMLRVTLDIVLVLITIIGGRIVPAFTANALRKRGLDASMRQFRWLDGLAIGSVVLMTVLDAFAPRHPWIVGVAAVAAIANVARLSGWGGMRTSAEPIVWVLHLGYLWLPVGLALKAIYLATGVSWASAWMHALGLGVAATMIIAVITRAALGHTGRPLVVSRSIALAYGTLGVAALVRALVPALNSWSEWGIRLTVALWTAAFFIVLFSYAPILLRPRVDGREG